jgi:hypothetical protein
MRKIFWVLTLASTAQTLVSLGIVLIPFVFTRCLEGMRHTDVLRVRIVGNEHPGGGQNRGVEDGGYE